MLPTPTAQASEVPRAPERLEQAAALALIDANALATLREDYLHTALELYHAAATKPGNVVVAPHTTATALAMLYSGAQGDKCRRTVACPALAFVSPSAGDAAHEALQSTMVQRATADTNTVITLASRLWLAADVGLKQGYQDLTARYFGTSAGVVDFASAIQDAARDGDQCLGRRSRRIG